MNQLTLARARECKEASRARLGPLAALSSTHRAFEAAYLPVEDWVECTMLNMESDDGTRPRYRSRAEEIGFMMRM